MNTNYLPFEERIEPSAKRNREVCFFSTKQGYGQNPNNDSSNASKCQNAGIYSDS